MWGAANPCRYMFTSDSRTMSGEMSYPLKLSASRPRSSGVSALWPSSPALAARMCLYDEMRNPAVPQAGSSTTSSFFGSTTATMKSMMWRGVRNCPASPWAPRTESRYSKASPRRSEWS